MSIDSDFTEIANYAHFWNWLPDWEVAKEVYRAFPESYAILLPFAYSYMEELIRSTTSEYGIEASDDLGSSKNRKSGKKLIGLAIQENGDNKDFIDLLEKMKSYYTRSQSTDQGDNRHSVVHGYMHSVSWTKDSFAQLIHDIALLSRYAKF
jgi:hypothetical protein